MIPLMSDGWITEEKSLFVARSIIDAFSRK
jgi:hypothetical protein